MTPTINTARAVARHLKKADFDLPIILGDAQATLLPEEILVIALMMSPEKYSPGKYRT